MRPQVRYFGPSDDGTIPWPGFPIANDQRYAWRLDPRTEVLHLEEVDAMTDLLLEAIESALDDYCAEPRPEPMRAGVFLEILANALVGRGGLDLTFRFRPAIDGGEVSVPARP